LGGSTLTPIPFLLEGQKFHDVTHVTPKL